MIQIYYEDSSSQVIRPSNQFQPTAQNIKDLVYAIAGKFPVKYYISDFKK
jgi:hypothetical protein